MGRERLTPTDSNVTLRWCGLFSLLVKPPRVTRGLRPETTWAGAGWGVRNCGAGAPPSGHSPLREPVRDEMFAVKLALQVRPLQVTAAKAQVPLRKGLWV